MKPSTEDLFCCPLPTPDTLWVLAREYHLRTEAFDRTVCTGPIGPDGVIPANPREVGLVSRNSREVMAELRKRAEGEGYSLAEFRTAIHHYAVSRQCVDDMRAAFPPERIFRA